MPKSPFLNCIAIKTAARTMNAEYSLTCRRISMLVYKLSNNKQCILYFIHDSTWHCAIATFFLYFLFYRCNINNKLTTITECFRCKCLVFTVHRLCVCFVPDQIWYNYLNVFNFVSILVNVNLSHMRSNTLLISSMIFLKSLPW